MVLLRKQLDISFLKIFKGMLYCWWSQSESSCEQTLKTCWKSPYPSHMMLSVRSSFDALLTACKFPAGSEILMTAITISDMPRIAQEHHLKVIPLDFDPLNMTITREQLQAAITPQTKAVVIAHLFGAVLDIQEIYSILREHQLLIIGDFAQAYGLRTIIEPEKLVESYDVCLWSFGPIKDATALGGAVLECSDIELFSNILQIEKNWLRNTRISYFRRLCKYLLIKILTLKMIISGIYSLIRYLGKDPDQYLNGLARGFKKSDLFKQIRKRPPLPLINLLASRISTTNTDYSLRAKSGSLLKTQLSSWQNMNVPNFSPCSYWVFPVLVKGDRKLWIQRARDAGIDATAGTTNIMLISDDKNTTPLCSKFMNEVIYLPLEIINHPAALSQLIKISEVIENA